MRRLALALLLAAGHAAADPKTDEARAHFKQGKAFQDVGAFDKAADEYKAAYAIDPRAEMLFDIAQAYRLGGQAQQALDYFQQYLTAQPSGAGADEARQHVAELTKQLADERERSVKAAPPPPAPPPPAPPPPTAPKLVTRRGSPALRIGGLATAGAGVVACGLAVKFGLDARSDADAISRTDRTLWTDADRRTYEHGQAANRHMMESYAVGGALVVTGAVLYWVGARTHVVPVVDAQTAMLTVGGEL